MSEAPKRYEDLSTRREKSHFLYPVMEAATADPLLRRSPSWLVRHSATASALEAEMMGPSEKTREYWEEHKLPQPRAIDGRARYLLRSGYQDFGRIARSANRRLLVEGVRKSERPQILLDSHDLLQVAHIGKSDLAAMTEPDIPIFWLATLVKPDAVYFGRRSAIPLRGSVYDADKRAVTLSDTYSNWIEAYRNHVNRAAVGCPAANMRSDRSDGRTTMLEKAWEGYVRGVYAGKPKTA